MATVTLGTVSSTALTALQIVAGQNSAADLATLRAAIDNDLVQPSGNSRPIWPGSIENGRLSIPNRGVLSLLPGDWVAVDPVTGAVILVPVTVLPSTLQTTGVTISGSAVVTGLGTSTSALGWLAGMAITGSNFSTGTIIQSIVPGGSSLVLNLTVAASSAAATMTAGSPFTHG